MIKDYADLDVLKEVNHKISTINKTRENRINMSMRLKGYSDKWSLAFFFLNIEAVIFVTLSLAGKDICKAFNNETFGVISGIFSLYVILLQYYINDLNYKERSLKAHYHQLELEDLILNLKTIIMIHNKDKKINGKGSNEEVQIEKYNIIMNKYQTILKNNENHDSIDNDRRESKPRNIHDFTVDNIILKINMFFIIPGALIMILRFILL
ncbi:SLATT domain-containing protein [Clostridium sporogenes]|uniref:SLATT domain-containing protein n=1 Tax=Clostridium sporogenes TaxID=1509 RepID=UPI0022383474|nr:SLATT domain-containing protein [Clostridium sporogenes]MCW6088796.1 SLATT domain-containing protein [Clostridium sporogenes]